LYFNFEKKKSLVSGKVSHSIPGLTIDGCQVLSTKMDGKYGLLQMGCIRYSLQDMSISSIAQRRCIEGTYNTVNAKKVEPTEGGEST
jgi:hypothetical protein